MDLQLIWFLLLGVLLAGYSVLDGFDLGVGALSLFSRSSEERRIYMNAIGPVWDGNEVWLLTGGGAMFAAFPPVYATVFSGFYLALMLLLVALIARAVSFEFRSKVASPTWRRAWDIAFGLGSLLPAVLLGVALGNILRGIPVDAAGEFRGTFLGLLNPYALVIGLGSLSLFVMHGAAYMVMKTEGELQDRMRKWVVIGWVLFVLFYLKSTILTFFMAHHLMEGVLSRPLLWPALAALCASIVIIPLASSRGRALLAFLASSTAIVALWGILGVSVFPNLVTSTLGAGNHLSIYTHSASPLTLQTMLVIALIGVPIVLVYTAYVYRVFKGKVKITPESY